MRNLILKKNHTQYFLTHESKKADTALCLCIAIYSCRQYKAVQFTNTMPSYPTTFTVDLQYSINHRVHRLQTAAVKKLMDKLPVL